MSTEKIEEKLKITVKKLKRREREKSQCKTSQNKKYNCMMQQQNVHECVCSHCERM